MYLKLGTQLPYLKLGTQSGAAPSNPYTPPSSGITQVYLGSSAFTGFNIGSTTISSVYVGAAKVWGSQICLLVSAPAFSATGGTITPQ